MYDAYDTNGDGIIDADEFMQGQMNEKTFYSADENNDNALSREEWIKKFGSDEHFDAYDADGDGKISAEEFLAGKKAEADFAGATSDGKKLDREAWKAKYGTDANFDAYDANGDGIIDADEFIAGSMAKGEFQKMDIDNDGKISKAEWIARYGSAEGFDKYDLDGDGVIDPDEFIATKGIEAQVRMVDKNRDGKISEAEWKARFGSMEGFDKYASDGGVMDADAWMTAQMVKAKYRMLDTNHDGKISREEWIARYGNDTGFLAYDLNGDGVIDADEFLAAQPVTSSRRRWDGLERGSGKFYVPGWDGLPVQTLVPPEVHGPDHRSAPRHPAAAANLAHAMENYEAGGQFDQQAAAAAQRAHALDCYEEAADAMAEIQYARTRGKFCRVPPGSNRSWESKRYNGAGAGWRVAAATQGGQYLFGAPTLTPQEAAAYRGGYSSYTSTPEYHLKNTVVGQAGGQFADPEQAAAAARLGPSYQMEQGLANSLAVRELKEAEKMQQWSKYTRGMRQPNAVRYRYAGGGQGPW